MAEPVKGRTEAGRAREQRARETRHRIVTAATSLFVERGYAAATVEAIATAAGVAPATVYQAFGTKASILAQALDEAIVGDAQAAPLLDRDWVQAARRESDAARRLAIVVDNTASVTARTAPLKEVMRDAAATEPSIRELVDRDDLRRLATQRELVEIVLGTSPPDDAIASFYLLVNSQTYLLSVRHLGWNDHQWRQWLIQALSKLLLDTPD